MNIAVPLFRVFLFRVRQHAHKHVKTLIFHFRVVIVCQRVRLAWNKLLDFQMRTDCIQSGNKTYVASKLFALQEGAEQLKDTFRLLIKDLVRTDIIWAPVSPLYILQSALQLRIGLLVEEVLHAHVPVLCVMLSNSL